jgi:hypothetical protein
MEFKIDFLLDKEITIVPPSIRLFLNPHGTDVVNTEYLIKHILGKKGTMDNVSSKFEKKNEYLTLARATDDLCGVSSKLVDSLILFMTQFITFVCTYFSCCVIVDNYLKMSSFIL